MYLSLFLVAFLAATLLPAQSEVLVVSAQQMGYNVWLIWLSASVGNTLGSVVNYLLGRFLLKYQHRRWFPFKGKSLERGHWWFERYGKWSLLLAWAPFIGDALTFIAGMLRLRFWQFLVIVWLSKAGRYALLLGLLKLWFEPLAA
ncbi:Inner membrane protein YqaA [Pseudidiomarina piscicola]|uniref:Inner membrane protein YqaA n=1 Tax=Pseudidiomarina piscicola TaxID=2614830 RepID=A0A6S6WUA1_9GAMM|nr:YqaA family protein [Pseudidiomarina piscicola]CAB0150714.1 Inner membrane protein YqaA [Pseudidiomarina piscicola]VZT40220.1 Inner membrane protein YqaA [Pseudomonas aeruginosa]